MHRLMRLVEAKRVDLTPMLTHTFDLDDIVKAYEVFGARKENCIKVAIRIP
jgi:threonine dehydrogenase-like Zn-dependent dehydrogenase